MDLNEFRESYINEDINAEAINTSRHEVEVFIDSAVDILKNDYSLITDMSQCYYEFKNGTKALIYIGTNKAIGKFYDFLVGAFPQYKHQIGIYTSIVPDDQKEDMLNKRIILSTTKSCGAGMDIHGLKVSVVLAEPFRSEVLTRQTLGRTRANNTLYIDCIDDGFFYCKSYFNSKKPIFSKYATKCTNIATMNDFEIQDRIKTIDEKPKLFCPVRRLKENEV